MKRIIIGIIGIMMFSTIKTTIYADELEPKLTCKYEMEHRYDTLNKVITSSKLTSNYITIKMTIGSTEMHVKKYNSSNVEIPDESNESILTSKNIITNFSCPKYIVPKSDGIIGADGIEDIKMGVSGGIFLELTDYKRNANNLCYYHSEQARGMHIYNGSVVLDGHETYSVYVDLDQKIYFTFGTNSTRKLVYIANDFNEDTCPEAYLFNMDQDNPEYKITSTDTKGEGLVLHPYIFDKSGNMVSSELENIKKKVITATEELKKTTYNTELDADCVGTEPLTANQYKVCSKYAENDYNAYSTTIKKAKIVVSEAERAGLSDSAELKELKKAIEDAEKLAGKTYTVLARLVSKNRCIYKSNKEDIYIALVRQSDPGVESKYNIVKYDDSTLTSSKSIMRDSLNFAIYKSLCGLKQNYDKIKDTFECYDKIKYDTENDTIVFFDKNMKDNKDTWDKQFELIGIEYANEYASGEYVKTDYKKLDNIEKYIIESDGFMFEETCEIADISNLIDFDGTMECKEIFDSETLDFIKKAYFFIEVLSIVLVIVLSVLDYSQIIINDNQDEFKKANKKLIRRILLVITIFLLPALVNIVLGLFKINGINSDNPLCVDVTEK